MHVEPWLENFLASMPGQRKMQASLATPVIWELWCERNRRLFQNTELGTTSFVRLISDEANLWELAGARHVCLRE